MDNEQDIKEEISEEDQAQKLLDQVEAFALQILEKRDDAVLSRAQSGIERRMREDELAYEGYDPVLTGRGEADLLDYVTGEAYRQSNTGPNRSKVIVNVIRPKVQTAVGRFADILMPTDEKNWGLETTPVPDLMDGLKDKTPASDAIEGMEGAEVLTQEGQAATVSDVARAQLDEAQRRMTLMENEIADLLDECGFNGECREAIFDSARLGTGIIKGPRIVRRIKKAYTKQEDESGIAYVVEQMEEMRPESVRVDPWRVFPDPHCGGDQKKLTYVFEYDEVTPRELRSLIGVEGYFPDQIMRVLDMEPKRTRTAYTDKGIRLNKYETSKGATYERWEYYGDVSREDLEILGVESDGESETVSACIVFVNDVPIKVALNTLDSGDIPYDFFQWSEVSGSLWGVGLPREMMWQQRIVIGAWRAMMDNAGDSAGANVIINRKLVEPADGRWEMAAKKLWFLTAQDADVRNAFAQFQMANSQEALQKIIELALKFTDIETTVPMMFQGEKSGMPDTLGATNIIVDSNNVALRSRVKRWDDRITRRHLQRYYAWYMEYGDNDEAKGDYNVSARGLSALLIRDQQAQELAQFFQLRQDPMMSVLIDWKKAVREYCAAKRLDIMNPDEVIEAKEKEMQDAAAQQGQQGPQDMSLQVAQTRVQGEMEKAKLVQQSDMAELNFKAEEAERQRQHERYMKEIDLQIKQMEFAERRNIGLDKIKADLAQSSEKLNVQVALAKDKTAVGPQISEPPVEPAGRAADGRAFPE